MALRLFWFHRARSRIVGPPLLPRRLVHSPLLGSAPPAPQMPELKKFMEKRVSLKLNASRTVSGRLRGYDHFMNVVLDEAVEETSGATGKDIGLVLIRGNSIIQIEALERIGAPPAAAPPQA